MLKSGRILLDSTPMNIGWQQLPERAKISYLCKLQLRKSPDCVVDVCSERLIIK